MAMADQNNVKTVLANGAPFSYQERGTGEPVIFVHGSLGDYRTWMPQFDPFAQKYRAITYSRRYHYPNPWAGSGTDYSPSTHANDLIALIESLRLAPVNIVGTSFGAYTTLVTAVRRPDLIRKLVICEPPILPWLKEVPGGQEYWDNFMRTTWMPATQAFQSGDLQRGVRLFVEAVSGQPGSFDQIPDAARSRMLDNARSLQAETASPDYFTKITPEQVSQISPPVLLLRGDRSPKMFHLILDQVTGCFNNPLEATIPNASHSMASNNPPAFNQIVMSFLS